MANKKMKAYRSAPRKDIEPLQISSITILESLTKICSKALIVEASITGFLVTLKREDLIPQELRSNLSLAKIEGCTVLIYLPQMNLEISGKIARTRLMGKKGFELGIDYSSDAPEYWRECLVDLLPAPGELSDD